MLVPTLPEARYLILNDGDLPSLVSVAIASERWNGEGQPPVTVPAWWGGSPDVVLPLVHRSVQQQADVFGVECVPDERVVELRDDQVGAAPLSVLLLGAVDLAARLGCDSVLFPIRATDLNSDRAVTVDGVAREIDRAALIGRLAALDAGAPRAVITPLVDFDDEQMIDLARDLAVPAETCWWTTPQDDEQAAQAASRWRDLRGVPAGVTEDHLIRSA